MCFLPQTYGRNGYFFISCLIAYFLKTRRHWETLNQLGWVGGGKEAAFIFFSRKAPFEEFKAHLQSHTSLFSWEKHRPKRIVFNSFPGLYLLDLRRYSLVSNLGHKNLPPHGHTHTVDSTLATSSGQIFWYQNILGSNCWSLVEVTPSLEWNWQDAPWNPDPFIEWHRLELESGWPDFLCYLPHSLWLPLWEGTVEDYWEAAPPVDIHSHFCFPNHKLSFLSGLFLPDPSRVKAENQRRLAGRKSSRPLCFSWSFI